MRSSARLFIANRTPERAERLAERYPGQHVQSGGYESLAGTTFDLVLNATSASLTGALPPLPRDCLDPGAVCYDLLYSDRPTVFMLWAEQEGAAQVFDGWGMLVEQAAESFQAVARDAPGHRRAHRHPPRLSRHQTMRASSFVIAAASRRRAHRERVGVFQPAASGAALAGATSRSFATFLARSAPTRTLSPTSTDLDGRGDRFRPLKLLAGRTDSVRTYTVEGTLGDIPRSWRRPTASRVMLGGWVDGDRQEERSGSDRGLSRSRATTTT